MRKVLEGVLRGAARRGSVGEVVEAIGDAWPKGEARGDAIRRHMAAIEGEAERAAMAGALLAALAAVDPGLSRGCAAAVATLRPEAATAMPGVGEAAPAARWTLGQAGRAAFDQAVRCATGEAGPLRRGQGIVFASPRGIAAPDGRREWDVMTLTRREATLDLAEAGRYVGHGRRPPHCSVRAEVSMAADGTFEWRREDLPAIACGNYRIAVPGASGGADPEGAFAADVRRRCGIEPRVEGDPDDRPATRLRVAREEIEMAVGDPATGRGAGNPVAAALASHREAAIQPVYVVSPGRERRSRLAGRDLHGLEALVSISEGFGRRSTFRTVTLEPAVTSAIGHADPAVAALLARAVAVSVARDKGVAREGARARGVGRG